MKIIGITGGVGCGKSRVLEFMKEEFGAYICQSDHVAWELQRPGHHCFEEIVSHFGSKVLNADGSLDRRALGEIVFGDERELDALNRMMHPAIKSEIKKRIRQEEGRCALFVLEGALLIEEDYSEICDEMWYIYTSEQIRRERLATSRGYSQEKISQMISSQLPEEVFRRTCQVVIDNSGTFDETIRQVKNRIIGR